MGSLSGGCVEEDLVARLVAGELSGVQVLQYGVTAEENERAEFEFAQRLQIAAKQRVVGDDDVILRDLLAQVMTC